MVIERWLIKQSLFFIVISIIYIAIYQNTFYVMMIWNLLLAWIPYILSKLSVYLNVNDKKLFNIPVLLIWVLFFPNSFYTITDLIHVRVVSDLGYWFHLTMLFLLAWIGIVLAYLSLRNIMGLLKSKIAYMLIMFLTSFGIYLGRFLRFNSWDLFSNPLHLIQQALFTLTHIQTWGFIVLFTCLLYFINKTLDNIHH